MDRPVPLTRLGAQEARGLRLLVSDIDGTLTQNGKFATETITALGMVKDAGMQIILATGRSSATGYDLALYFPHIAGVICENGSVFYKAGSNTKPSFLRSGLRGTDHRRNLEAAFARLRTVYPQLERTDDDTFRVTEIAVFREDWITPQDLIRMSDLVAEQGLGFTYSSVHLHIMAPDVDKWAMVKKISPDFGVDNPFAQILTVGDSVNDAALFDPLNVNLSVGVSQVDNYLPALGERKPRFVCKSAAVSGFMEIAAALKILRKNTG